MHYIITIGIFAIIICFLFGILVGYSLKKTEYKSFAIRTIKAVRNGNTWEFNPPFNVAADTNYIFIVDMPKGQKN